MMIQANQMIMDTDDTDSSSSDVETMKRLLHAVESKAVEALVRKASGDESCECVTFYGFFGTGMLGAVMLTILGSISWQLIASAFMSSGWTAAQGDEW